MKQLYSKNILVILLVNIFFISSCKKERGQSEQSLFGFDKFQVETFFNKSKQKSVYFAGEGRHYDLDWTSAALKKSGGEDFLQFKVTDDIDIVFSNKDNQISGYYNKHQSLVEQQSGKIIDFVLSTNLENDKEYIACYYNHKRLIFLPVQFLLGRMALASGSSSGNLDISMGKSAVSNLKDKIIMATFWQHLRCWMTFSVWKENGSDGPGCYGLDLQAVWSTIKSFIQSEEYVTAYFLPDFSSIQNILSWGSSTGLGDYGYVNYTQHYAYHSPDGTGTVDPNNGTTIDEIGGNEFPPDLNLLIDLIDLTPASQDFFLYRPYLTNKIANYILETGGNTAENRIFIAWVQTFLKTNPSVTQREFDNFMEAIRQNSYRPRDRAPQSSLWRQLLIDNNDNYDAVFTRSQPQFLPSGAYNPNAFNCHYWAFKDEATETLADYNQPKWVLSVDFSKFNLVTGNVQVGDRIIYLAPQKNQPNGWLHSGIVTEVDQEGYATKISSKMGDYDVIEHHPRDIPSKYGSPEPTFMLNGKEYPARMYFRKKN